MSIRTLERHSEGRRTNEGVLDKAVRCSGGVKSGLVNLVKKHFPELIEDLMMKPEILEFSQYKKTPLGDWRELPRIE